MANSDSSKPFDESSLFVCWTTVSTEKEALSIANAFVTEGIAACVQIDGPVSAVYVWEDERCCSPEYRLWLKILAPRLEKARVRIKELHPYDTPQWIEVKAEHADEKYLIWAQEASNLRGFQIREPK